MADGYVKTLLKCQELCHNHGFTSSRRLRFNSTVYIEVLQTVVKPQIELVRNERSYIFQQDSSPPHKVKLTLEWMAENFRDHVTPDIWLPSSPDLNLMDYYVWGILEKEVNA